MACLDELRQEIELLRDRISKLCTASLRISESLDVDTVLQEIVESARALTGARYGVITTIDDSGQPEEFISSGFTQDEHQRLADWSDGLRLFEHLRDVPGPLRLSDLPGYVESLGLSPDLMPSGTAQLTPMCHLDAHVGTFFLSEKEGGREFTTEDEEVLVMFASHAARAIHNARTYRNEQRARADLEALVDTSPVGVVVFDAGSGKPVRVNREAERIVAGLSTPESPLEKLPELVTIRFPDGREISLKELPFTQALRNSPTIRAEEVVLQVPDGPSITTLINATPIRSGSGEVESVVITLQDLAPLEEVERLRTEFLGMVSHELRVPLAAIKGSALTVLGAAPVPETPEMLQFFRVINEQADHMRRLIGDLLDAGHIESGTLSVAPEPADLTDLVDQARNMFLSGGGRNTVHIDLPPDLPLVMADKRRIVQVLNNLLSNAARHSPEVSPIQVAAVQDGVFVSISVTDEGSGVPPELLPHLFQKHTRLGGDRGLGGFGLGLAICRGLVEAHGGRIRAENRRRGFGARFTFTIPVIETTETGMAARTSGSSSRRLRVKREQAPILVVDDDPQTLRFVRDALTEAGHLPLVTGDPREVPQLVQAQKPQLVLLDLILPGIDGIELMERIPQLADLPVIFISGYGRDETIAKALETGAADYIVKPFSPTELVARVQAALRRREKLPEPFRLGDLAIYYAERRVTMGARPVPLTSTEFELLQVLSLNAGRVLTYASLLRQVWGRRETGDHRLVRSFVKMLRRKLGDDAASPKFIFNERRVGYRMARQDDQ